MRVKGSPPRVRGKQYALIAEEVQIGITPARAGKTRNFCRRRCFMRDHPRACGENVRFL